MPCTGAPEISRLLAQKFREHVVGGSESAFVPRQDRIEKPHAATLLDQRLKKRIRIAAIPVHRRAAIRTHQQSAPGFRQKLSGFGYQPRNEEQTGEDKHELVPMLIAGLCRHDSEATAMGPSGTLDSEQ